MRSGPSSAGAPMPSMFARRMFVRPAAEPVEGLEPGSNSFGEYREPKLCAVVPSRNHYAALGTISATLKGHGLKVFIIDDGSDEPARWQPDCAMPLNAASLMQCKSTPTVSTIYSG